MAYAPIANERQQPSRADAASSNADAAKSVRRTDDESDAGPDVGVAAHASHPAIQPASAAVVQQLRGADASDATAPTEVNVGFHSQTLREPDAVDTDADEQQFNQPAADNVADAPSAAPADGHAGSLRESTDEPVVAIDAGIDGSIVGFEPSRQLLEQRDRQHIEHVVDRSKVQHRRLAALSNHQRK